MPEVKYIWVRMSETGAKETKAAVEGVARATEEVRTNLNVKTGVDGFAATMAQLRMLRDASRDMGIQIDRVRIDADRASAAVGDSKGGFFSKLFGVLKAIGGFKIGPVPVGGIGLGLAVAPAFGSIFGGTMGIIPLLAAATIGVASFGALAFPTFQKVAAAIGLTGDKLRDLPQPLRGTVIAVQGVVSTFTGLAKVLGPQVMPIIRDLAPGIKQLVGDMGPFAHAVAPVLDSLAKSFSKFTMSAGFKQFLDQMLRLTGPAIATIGEGIGKLAVAFGKFLEALINPHALTELKLVFTALAGFIQILGNVIHWLATAGTAVGHFAVSAGHFINGLKVAFDLAMGGLGMALDTATRAIGRFFGADIPHWISVGMTWFMSLPGRIARAFSGFSGMLFSLGQSAMEGLWNGLKSIGGSILSWVGGFVSSLWSAAKGMLGIKSPSTKFFGVGMDIMLGLRGGMKAGAVGVFNVLHDLGIQIADKLMDAFMSRNDKRADAAGAQIAAIIKARLEQIRSVIIGVAQAQVAWASIVSAATGPAFTSPHWVPGTPGTPATFSHTGVPTGGTPATPGHWAGGQVPPTGAQLLRNLRLDLGRLKAFAHVMARLRRMGLDPVLWQQILAAGPDQGYQIAEAILDAGRGEIRALNATERQIYQTGIGLGRTAAKSQFGGGITYVINFNGFIAGNPRDIARQIQKWLAELKRHNGGAALGLG